ncbi:MAG: hypothetical protein BGO31_04250 [Bacteroidetes bacterium 43-16]|nr:MAG: hypothetical protein BGO31_04250 [Bacteroidetes bacterium 43-16]
MENETSTLKVTAERLGTIKEIKELLTDFENAYNSIYAFEFLVDTLSEDRERRRKLIKEEFRYIEKKLERPEPYWFDFLDNRYLFRNYENSTNLLEILNKIDIEKIILPTERLSISRVNIQSPGFWEFLGSLNPLQQIREYIKDRHERKKDNRYRSRQEEELGDLNIMKEKNNVLSQRIEILRGLGYSEVQIRELVIKMVIEPLNKLGEHQDKGQIEGLEN